MGGVVRVRALEGGGANIVGPGVGGQRLGILYFWRGSSVRGYYGDRHWIC